MIAQKINQLLLDNKAFVFFKKPLSDYASAFIQDNAKLYHTKNFEESGFVFAPFDKSKPAVLFPKTKTSIINFEIEKTNEITTINKRKSKEEKLPLKEKHLKLVTKTINFIQSEKADKIVISRIEKQDFEEDRIGQVFEKMLNNKLYSEAMVYLWHHPLVGTWLGATPEKLIELEGKNYKTMALAGTQIYTENCQWNKKEIQEQDWVTASIKSELKPLSEKMVISSSFTKKAGHLAHICSSIEGKLKENTNLETLLNHLHPTPAVCGTPTQVAKEFILNNEGYDRSFYTGFLGTINLENNTNLFVNLRCMQIKEKQAFLYVGGGITKDSNAEKEWDETVNKAQIMRNLL